MKKLAVLAFVWLTAASDVLPALQERAGPFALAVLRRDGLALPFATFNGRRWQRPWPADLFRDIPISVSSIPKDWWGLDVPPERMTRWSEAAPAGEVTLTGVLPIQPMCLPRMTLKTDYKSELPLPPPIERPYPKDGLLVTGEATLRPIAVVEKDGEEWKRLSAAIVNDFNRAESDATRAFTSWSHPIGAGQRRRVPISLEAAYRALADEDGWTAYFVEVFRQFPARPGDRDNCGLATFASGWVMIGPRKEERVRLSALITYCDRNGVTYMLPFGLVTANQRTYWIVQFGGFEGEWYEVLRPTPGRTEIAVSYPVGVCD